MSSSGDESQDEESEIQGEIQTEHPYHVSYNQSSQSEGHKGPLMGSGPRSGESTERPLEAGEDGGEDDDDDDGEDDDDNIRQNRFSGSEVTWRFYTQEERGLAASLDQQRANDLSVHLYNAHALKARHYHPDAAQGTRPWHSKQQWMKLDENGSLPWLPPRHWTAWPLPPEDVPRREEVWGAPLPDLETEAHTDRMPEKWTPSADLQDEITAFMQRLAKERFRIRRWLDEEDAHKLPNFDFLRSDIMTDDQEARAILQPSVRHILSKFDDLLVGLHKSRQGHYQRQIAPSRSQAFKSRSKSPTANGTEVNDLGEATKPFKCLEIGCGKAYQHPNSLKYHTDHVHKNLQPLMDANLAASKPESAAQPSKRRRLASGPGSDSDPPDASDGDDEIERQRPREPRKKYRISTTAKTQPNLRDWSEVLGMASLMGWDRSVVHRAAQRCASLFGEGMSFSTIPTPGENGSAAEVVSYVPTTEPLAEPQLEAGDSAPESELQQPYYCPYTRCPLHEKAWGQPWRWRDHLKGRHGLSTEQVEEVERSFGLPEAAPRAEGDARASPNNDEEDDGDERLSDHVDLSVRYGAMKDGLHVDGFLQPVHVVFRDNNRSKMQAKET